VQPSDEDEEGNVLTVDELALNRRGNSNCTTDKQDAKPAPNKKNKRHHPLPNGTEYASESKMMRLKRRRNSSQVLQQTHKNNYANEQKNTQWKSQQ
jgi:hypothetical protein